MEKKISEHPPTYRDSIRPWTNRRRKRRAFHVLAAACITYLAFYTYRIAHNTERGSHLLIEQLRNDYATCSTLRQTPLISDESRDYNKRWVNGTKPLLIRNATVWTGESTAGTSEEDARRGKGYAWMTADVFVDRGLILKIEPDIPAKHLPEDTEVFDAKGRQLTAGIVDMHSHAGLGSVGNLQDDGNEMSNDITPFVKSIDGLDPLHPEFQWIKSGGVTTSLILPGSANNMGGEAFVLKFAVGKKNGREEISQQDMFADPDKTWRYMKMACGENPKSVYGDKMDIKQGPFSRLGEAWEFRHAFEHARDHVREQDEWCATANKIGAENMPTYLPQQLKWESLGAVLRGQVRINTHCYTIPDLEAFVRHTNEFKFRVYAFHHAHQTFLIPEVLKRAWGGTPAAALFADNMYYKVEAYTASEKAGKILYENGITPTYVSDNPVLNSQHVVFEAAKAYGYGLPYHAALAGVTSAPAELLGLGHRIGKIKENFDADIVVWDSDPLSAGAAPVQVWIDGAPQFEDPVVLKKPASPPIVPDDALAKETEMDKIEGAIIFTGISKVLLEGPEDSPGTSETVVVITNGTLSCVGPCKDELSAAKETKTPIIHLKNGYLTPPLTAFGAPLGLIEIDAENYANDGPHPNDDIARAVDGLSFGGKQLARAFEHGVTRAVSAPYGGSLDHRGISSGFHTGAKNALEDGAIWKDEVALHYGFGVDSRNDKSPSVSSLLSALRRKLLNAVDSLGNETTTATVSRKEKYEEKSYLKRVVSGSLPLVLSAHSADTISSIIRLKSEINSAISETSGHDNEALSLIIYGGAESYLVAKDLASARIPVVLAPLFPYAQSWDQRRSLTGAPLTNGTAIDALIDAGVLVGAGVEEVWETRDLGLLAGIAWRNSGGRLSEKDALALVGANFDKMVGVGEQEKNRKNVTGTGEWVVWEGSPLEIGGKVRGVGAMGRTVVWA